MHTSEQYLNHYLKESWGFEGFAVTDWNDIEKLVYFHHVAADNKEVPPNRTPDGLLLPTPFRSGRLTLFPPPPTQAIRMALLAGVDMSMVPSVGPPLGGFY